MRMDDRPNAGKGKAGRRGRSSARARARASSSTPVRMRSGLTTLRAGRLRLVPFLALQPGLEADADGGVLPRELDGGDGGVRERERPLPALLEVLPEGKSGAAVSVEDVADHFRAVRFHD